MSAPAHTAKRILFFTSLGALLLPACADSTAAPASPLLALLRKNYGPQSSFSAKFRQTIFWSVREKEETARGSILCAPGDRFRITLGKETFISNGNTYWNWNSETSQTVIRHLADVDRTSLPSQIFSRFLVSCSFREQERNNGQALLVWTTDSADAPYKSIRVRITPKNGRIDQCTMTDRNDNVFTYQFSSTALGINAGRENFEFTPPKNARCIDMRK